MNANETPVRNYIGGDWSTPTGQSGQSVINPATGEELSWVKFSSEEDLERAVTKARSAFKSWQRTPPQDRVQYLFDIQRALDRRQDELAEVLTKEHGKTRSEAHGEIRRGIQNVEVASGIPQMLRSQSGNVSNVTEDIDEKAVRQPLGVFAAVTPFNFPAMIPLWFLPYAVATGNTFVLKPSERVPLSSQILFEIIDEVGFPPGVVNLVNGGPDTVNTILDHDGIEGVSFVGSSPVAHHVYRKAADTGKRVQAQGGAKNYAVVTPSALLEKAVPNIIGSVYGNAGERCLANDVVVGVGTVYEELRERIIRAAKSLTVGNGLDDDVDIGPLITGDHLDNVVGMIESGIDDGADVILDGRDFELPDYADGTFLGPTILEGVTTDMEIAQEEIFGPVLCLTRADSLEEAIQMVNSTRYGNASSLFTERGGESRRFIQEVDAGNIGINVGVCGPMAFFHFGGRKESFFGDLHAQGEDAVQFYTDKTIAIERWYSD